MLQTKETEPLEACLRLIELQLGWGSSATWTHYDFEKLSQVVLARTGVRLSPTTLKRLWGKLKYESAPTFTTLNTLAQLAGYPDWRNFKQLGVKISPECSQQPGQQDPDQPLPVVESLSGTTGEESLTRQFPPAAEAALPTAVRKRHTKRVGVGIVLAMLLIIFLVSTSRINHRPAPIDSRDFSFKANKMITQGVPNSVVFEYDARAAKTDSVFIVQTWDIRRKTLVSKHNRAHSALYYYPGFFRTKLLVDGQVAKMHDLSVNTDGWLGLVEQEPIPLYFKKADFEKKDRVEIDEHTLKAYNLSLYPKAPLVRFFNQREMTGLMNDNFIFETCLKAPFTQGTGVCQTVEVLIQCKDEIVIIPLAAKACIGGLRLYFCGTDMYSKEADLSGFGCDLSQWTRLRVEVVNKHVKIFVNSVEAAAFTFPTQPAGIVGLQYRFNGLGAVKDTWFLNKRTSKVYPF